ncbi:hypothetical protein ACIQMV_08910 [Streptomyces sp. NPDC091412]|uniref:hypothetical protein n=1 Tax=Streptomyces sp. NPDC091412 TaxID=3366002 RepID=UPI003801F246
MTEPIRKSSLPTTPPPEFEFRTVLGGQPDSAGCMLLPGDTGPVVVRRRVTYGGWEPVRPDRWADEPTQDAGLVAAKPKECPPGVHSIFDPCPGDCGEPLPGDEQPAPVDWQAIAQMHAAATGRTGMGPVRGVVEDVADVRAHAEQYRHFADAARGASGARDYPDLTDTILALRDRAEQAEAALTRVRAESARIRAATRTWEPVADRIDAALDGTDQPREQRERPTHPDGTPYRYHEMVAEGWEFCDGCRMWSTATPERPHQCAETHVQGPVVGTARIALDVAATEVSAGLADGIGRDSGPAAVERLRSLHCDVHGFCDECSGDVPGSEVAYPCKTMRIIDGTAAA